MSNFTRPVNGLKILGTPAVLLASCLVMSDFGRTVTDSRPPPQAKAGEFDAARRGVLAPVPGWLASCGAERHGEGGQVRLFAQIEGWRTSLAVGQPPCDETAFVLPGTPPTVFQGRYLSIMAPPASALSALGNASDSPIAYGSGMQLSANAGPSLTAPGNRAERRSR